MEGVRGSIPLSSTGRYRFGFNLSTSPQVIRAGSILGVMAIPMLTDLRSRRSEILRVAQARGASRVRVFGSVARGDATEASDIDFLVDLDSDRGLFDLGGLLMDLRDLLDHDVDVVTEAGLRPRVAERVMADAIELRGATETACLT